jgi:hypothetical protein
MDKKQSAYLYGITSLQIGEIDCRGVGTPPQEVRLIPVGGVGVVLSYLSPDFGEVGIEDAIHHMRVLENTMQKSTVLPIRFGTLAESLDELKKMITRNEFAIKKELYRLKDKYEVGIKGYWRKEKIVAEMKHEKDYEALLAQTKNDPQSGIELGQRVEAIVNDWRDKIEAKYHPKLAEVATESTLGETMSVEMIYNGSFLVKPEQDLQLKERLLEIADQKLEQRFEFHYTTKLPPYNFVKLNLHWGNKR